MRFFFRVKTSGGKPETFGDAQVSLGNKSCNAFVEWSWNGETLTLRNDRYGFYPIYYYRNKDELAISPSIGKLLEFAENIEFDEDALAVFLRLGWLIGNDTLFSSIRAVPPGSVLTWQNGKFKLDSDGIIRTKPLKISRAEAMETYAELFQKSIEKNLPEEEDFIVPLSGGRDSRHILFSLIKANRKPPACLTILHPPPRPNEDARIAGIICKHLNLKHILLEQKRPRFDAEVIKNNITGYCAWEHAWFLALADFVAEKPQPVFDGIGGDVLSTKYFLRDEWRNLFNQGKFEELANNILEPEGYLPKMLKNNILRRFPRERAINYLSKEFMRHIDQPNPMGSFFFWNRTRRCIATSPFQLLVSSTQMITPYLETELFNFLASLPYKIFLDCEFHVETIRYAFPEYAHLPFEDKNPLPVWDRNYFTNFNRDIFRYSATNRTRKLTGRWFFLSRYLRCIIDKKYSHTASGYGEQAVHLLQLERL